MHQHLHALARAAADNDAVSEERGPTAALSDVGLDIEDVMAVSEQRAIRAYLQMQGRPIPQSAEFVALSQLDKLSVMHLTALVMDGIAIGWRARAAA